MVFGLVWASFRHIQVIGLGLGQGGELHSQFFEVVAGDLLVQMLWHQGPSYRPKKKLTLFQRQKNSMALPARARVQSKSEKRGGISGWMKPNGINSRDDLHILTRILFGNRKTPTGYFPVVRFAQSSIWANTWLQKELDIAHKLPRARKNMGMRNLGQENKQGTRENGMKK